MLLAGGEGQAEGPVAARIGGLAHQASRHLPDELLLGGDDARVRPAVAGRNRERLQFARHDIGIHGRLQYPQRYGLGKDHHQQGAAAVVPDNVLFEGGWAFAARQPTTASLAL